MIPAKRVSMKNAVIFFTILFLALTGAGAASSVELDAFQYRFQKKILAAFKIKTPAAREKAFMDLFYLEGADPKTKNVTVRAMYARSLVKFKNPKVLFKPVSKDFKQTFVSKGKKFSYNLPVLGKVVIKGKLGTSNARFQNFYGRKGNELFIVVPVSR